MITTINKAAVLHIPVSQYAFALDENTLTIRLRAAVDDLDKVELIWADRCSCTNPITTETSLMERKWKDELFDYFELTLSNIPNRFCYYFKLFKGSEWTYYYADTFTDELADLILNDGSFIEGRSGYYQYPIILREEIQHIPEWFKNAVVYNIFPDSFATGARELLESSEEYLDEAGKHHRRRLGGTIKGITENLSYIKALGFNCVYLNPIFSSGEYHKYDINDYFHIDPVLGSDEDFLALTDKAHELGLRVLIDGVFNHCGWQNDLFLDVVEKGVFSPYSDWFYGLNFPVKVPEEGQKPDYICFAYEKKMPKLNTSNPKVQDYFANVGAYWIDKFHVDGWRLDVANEIDKNFWRRFKKAVVSANPEAVLIGEVWENAIDWLKPDMLHSAMNYDFRKNCTSLFARSNISVKKFENEMTKMWLRYSSTLSYGQLNLLDSHDVARFLSLCENDVKRFRAAVALLFFFPGVPGLFYGDELDVSGVSENEYRRPMPWNYSETSTRDEISALLKIRKDWVENDSEFKFIDSDTNDHLLIMDRAGANTIRLIINTSEEVIDINSLTHDGLILHSLGLKNGFLNGFGYLIVKIH